MDRYEEQLKSATSNVLAQMDIDLGDLAEERLQRLVATITRLLTDEQERFDVVISGGDSGLIVTKIVEKVYETLGIEVPPTINFPIQRYTNTDFQQRFHHTDLGAYLPPIHHVKNVLFVDDEIRIGWTAKTCFETIQEKYNNRLDCVIVAENHFFEWHFKQPDINLRFYAHAKVIPGINQIFAHLIEDSEYQCIQTFSKEIQDRQQAVALLISGKYKKFTGDTVFFDEELEKDVFHANSSYQEMKRKVGHKIKMLVQRGVDRYKSGDIRIKF